MHVRELVELAALVAIRSPEFVRSGASVPQAAIEQYWVASKCRIDRWLRLVRRLSDAGGQLPLPATLSWPRVQPALEEMLASELLTRIWTAAAVAYDQSHSEQELAPIARNIWLSHLEVRRRLLQLLADGRVLESSQAKSLDHLRRRLERWNDMLLAHVSPLIDTREFAFEPARARDFAEDLDQTAAAAQRTVTSQLVQASLTASFAGSFQDRSPNADLNRRIGTAILACLQEDLLTTPELAGSLWLERMARTATDAQGMVDELVRLEASS